MNRSANMRAIRSKGMKPELTVRRIAHGLGYRYRLHGPDLPGKPDLVFAARRKAVFIHGCFWHGHGCKLSHVPKSNQGYWLPKLQRNKVRDAQHVRALTESGWKVLVIWECEIAERAAMTLSLRTFLGAPKTPR